MQDAYNKDRNAEEKIVSQLTPDERKELDDKHTPTERREELAKIGAMRAVKREWTQKNAQEVKVEAENKAVENKELREANAALNSQKAPVSEAETPYGDSIGNKTQDRETAKNEPVWARAANSVNSKIRPITEMAKPAETMVSEK